MLPFLFQHCHPNEYKVIAIIILYLQNSIGARPGSNDEIMKEGGDSVAATTNEKAKEGERMANRDLGMMANREVDLGMMADREVDLGMMADNKRSDVGDLGEGDDTDEIMRIFRPMQGKYI